MDHYKPDILLIKIFRNLYKFCIHWIIEILKLLVSKLLACNYGEVEYSDIPFHRSLPLKFPCRITNLQRETNYEYHESRWHSLLILFIKAAKLFSNKNSSSDIFPREKEDILQASPRYETFIQALLIKSRFSFLVRENRRLTQAKRQKRKEFFISWSCTYTLLASTFRSAKRR